ncbi:aldehyde dehydrogenase family protein, partial [Polymorphospora rubra]
MSGQPSGRPGLLRNYVGGEFVDTGNRFPKISPVTGQTIFEVAEADRSTVDAAVGAARSALAGPWGRMGERERAAVLYRVADELERRFDDLVAAEVGDTGKSISQA